MRRRGLTVLTYVVAAAITLGMNAGGLHAQGGLGPQGDPRTGPGGPGFGGPGFRRGGGPDTGFGVAGCLNSGKIIAGQGYTATLSYKQLKPVLNGAPIDHTITETIARDNDGRTQREITLPPFPNAPQGAPRQVICINDPVAGFGYMLDPGKMTARQFKLHQWKPNSPGLNGANPQADSGNANGPRPPRGPNANVSSVPLQAASAPAAISKECPGITGTQITRTVNIPENNGQISAIQIVTTRWYCPTLSMNLQTQTNDPLQGNTTTTITITGAGPAAIAVPNGYKIVTADAGPRGRGPGPGGPPPPAQQ